MKGINKVILVGNLGGDPEVRYTADGVAVARFSLATNETHNDKEGNRREHTEWHRIVAWGKLAETCGKHLAKGRAVYLEGKLRTSSWEQDGSKRSRTEIVVQALRMLGARDQEELPFEAPEAGVPEGDIPF
jgi:single-strand DNA-binding protein